MKRLITCGLAVAVLCGLAAPVTADTVYVPLAIDLTEAGVNYTTQVWISNRGGEERRFSAYFIPDTTNGTNRPSQPAAEITVQPGRTIVLTDIAPAGSRGLLEISGAPQLSVAARLVPTVKSVEGVGAALPILSSATMIPAGTTVQLQGWERSTGEVSDFGLVNLAHETASCQVEVIGPNGAPLIPTAVLSLQALTQVNFVDVLGLIGQNNISSVRASVTCDQPFYPYTASLNPTTGAVTVTSPSQDLTSTLRRPGDVPPPTTCTPGATCFEFPGVVHSPTSNNRVGRLEMDVPDGRYSIIKAQVDVFIGNWAANNTSGTHNVFWLALDKNKNLYGYVNVKGPNANTIFVRHGIGQPQGQKPRIDGGLALPTGRTYRFAYLYDTNQRVIELIVSDVATGQVLKVLNGAPDVNAIQVGGGETFLMDFGFGGQNPNEPPQFGWRYENVLFEIIP